MADRVRACWLSTTQLFALRSIAGVVRQAYGAMPYLVGSALTRADFRDVDVRVILPDARFHRMFPQGSGAWMEQTFWTLTCAAVSEWISARTGLPIDFQVQSQTEANRWPGPRNPLWLNEADQWPETEDDNAD